MTTRDVDPQRGDVIFGNRPSPVQLAMNVSKDPWTHTAVMGVVDGELRTIELGPAGCFSRSIGEFTVAYRHVGIASPAMHPECVEAVATAAEAYLASGELSYAWDACALLESIALLRCFAPVRAERKIVSYAGRASRRLLRRMDAGHVTCAGFVDLCLSCACATCRPSPLWPRRRRVSLWRAIPTVTDLRARAATADITSPDIVRLLSNPSDLWVADCWSHRSVHRDDLTTVLVDLAAQRCQRGCCLQIATPGRRAG